MSIISRKKSSVKPKSTKEVKIYSSLEEIPQFNWEQIIEHLRIQFIIKDERQRNMLVNAIEVREALDNMHDEYFKELDIDIRNDEYIILIQRRIELVQKYLEGDKSSINLIRAIDKQIEEIKRSMVKPDMVKNRLAVEKWFGHLDPHKKTALEFIKIVKLMQEEAEAIRNKNKGKGHDNFEG